MSDIHAGSPSRHFRLPSFGKLNVTHGVFGFATCGDRRASPLDEPTNMTGKRSSFPLWYTLRTLMITTLVICLAISHWHTSRRLADSEAQLRRLRDELGYLSIDDKTKVHAVALDEDEPNTWRWRLFIPKGHRYKWNIACEDIPRNSPPKGEGIVGISNEPYWETDNEVLVTARLRQNDDDSWALSVKSKIGDSKNQMAGASLTIPEEKMKWMFTVGSTDGRVIGSNGTAIRDPDDPIILLQRRPCEELPDGSYRPSDGPMPGFMVWLSKR